MFPGVLVRAVAGDLPDKLPEHLVENLMLVSD